MFCALYNKFFYGMKHVANMWIAIVLPVLLRYTDSDYPFGIFKLFLLNQIARYSFQHKLYNICTMYLYIYFTFREDLVSPPPVLVGSRCSSF
jgi:hypothetical protein